jgi:hypothetical protein
MPVGGRLLPPEPAFAPANRRGWEWSFSVVFDGWRVRMLLLVLDDRHFEETGRSHCTSSHSGSMETFRIESRVAL